MKILNTETQLIDNVMKDMGLLSTNSTIPTTNGQQGVTKNQQAPTKNQQNFNTNQHPVNPCTNFTQKPVNSLSEQAKQAKGDLEILVATGKTKEFTGKQLTFNDLDNMNEKDLIKFHRIYTSTLSTRVNDTFSKTILKSYSKLASLFLPIENEEKLYEDLSTDYILRTEVDKWAGWLTLKMGALMAIASTSLITVGNINYTAVEVEPPTIPERPKKDKITSINE